MQPKLPRLAAPQAGHAKQRGWARLPASAPAQAWLLAHHRRSLILTSHLLALPGHRKFREHQILMPVVGDSRRPTGDSQT